MSKKKFLKGVVLNVSDKEWVKAMCVRAVKTFFLTLAGGLGVGACISDIDWLNILSVAFVAFVLSVCTSLGGLPEVKSEI